MHTAYVATGAMTAQAFLMGSSMADIPDNTGSTAIVTGLSGPNGLVAGTFSGEIESLADHDWVRVELVAGQQYQFSLGLAGPVSSDAQLVLRDGAGLTIITDDDSGAGLNSLISFTALVSGTYFLDVGELGNNAIGAYSISVMNNTASPGVLKLLFGTAESYSALADERVMGGAGNDTLNAGNEGLDLFGEQGNDSLTGNALNNVLTGGIGNDFMIGQAGLDVLFGDDGDDSLIGGFFSIPAVNDGEADTLIGGRGNDKYYDLSNDVVIELEGEGYDGVFSDFSVTLLDSQSIEYVTLGDEAIINATGNASNNLLTGNLASNRLDGGSGNDTMAGGFGDDVFVVDSDGDVVQENANEGNDTVESWESLSINALVNVENIKLLGDKEHSAAGNALDNALTGNIADNELYGAGGNDTLSGGGGGDTLVGGGGNDTYVNPLGDMIIEQADGGEDTVQSSQSFSLAALLHVENLVLTGLANANASGNAAANQLSGNGGNNILNGQAGIDTMLGGAGNDTYYVDASGDVTTEVFGEGVDIVSSSVSRTLSANIENLNLSGASNIDGNGNTGANIVNGNAGNNILRGYEGADTLNGGGGNDILLGGSAGDRLNPGDDAVKDIIRFSAVGDSTGSQRDIVTGLDLTNEDKLDFTVVPTAIAFVGAGTLNLATINANLAAAVDTALAVNGAVLFDPTAGDMNVAGHLFIVVDANGDGVYKPNQDYVVQLVNSTGFLTLDDFV